MSGPSSEGQFDLSRGPASRTRLNNGETMPVFGLGVWQLPRGRATREAVGAALEAGYRLIDTASMYGNEADVGAAVRASGLARAEVFVTTKLWNDDQGYASALRAFERSRAALDLGPVDLYLLHWPVPGRRLDSWRALRELQQRGECRNIGVSNFTVAQLAELIDSSGVVPVVDQVEFSPFLYQRDLLDYCRREGIQLEAYAPLTRGRRLGDEVVRTVAAAHGRTPAQVLIRWGLQHRVVEIPKSSRTERIRENSGALGFELSGEEMRRLDALDEQYRTSWDPTTMA